MKDSHLTRRDQIYLENKKQAGRGLDTKDHTTNETITGTSPWTGHAYAITFLTDSTPTVLTDEKGTGTATGIVYSAGTTIYGSFTAVTLGSSESARLYKEK